MSHEAPQTSHHPIDTDRPYLVPRGTGNIEAWHVETNADGTPKVDEKGWIVLSGQHEEMNQAGEMFIPTKSAHPEALGNEAQSFYADTLAKSRPGATPEQFERYAHLEDDLAETALDAMGLNEENGNESNGLIREFLEEAPLGAIGELMQQVRARTDMLGQELDNLEKMLSHIQYAGGSSEQTGYELRNSYESLLRLVQKDGPEADLSQKVQRFYSSAEELSDSIRRTESATQEDRFKARKIDDAMAELHAANFTIVRGYDEIRSTLTPHGQFESYLEELLQTPQGYEYSIALLKSKITEMYDDAMMVRSRTVMLERAVEDLERLKNA